MRKYDFVFVVLTYKNECDLINFIKNIKRRFINYKIIVVNAHFNDEIDNRLEAVAIKNGCDFMNVANKGYSYGNNRGVEFANDNYQYSYLVIANPDTEVRKIDLANIKKIKNGIIAPKILTLTGKKQNPYWVIKNDLTEWMIYYGYKHRCKIVKYTAIGINKIHREIYCFFIEKSKKTSNKIFAAHGAFLILTYDAVCKLTPIFDENMFLFAEEAYLAHKAYDRKVPIFFCKDMEILHKEDGSIQKTNINEQKIARQSVIYYYERLMKSWRKR